MKPSIKVLTGTQIRVLTVKVASFELGIMRAVVRRNDSAQFFVSFYIQNVKQPFDSVSDDLSSAICTARTFAGDPKPVSANELTVHRMWAKSLAKFELEMS